MQFAQLPCIKKMTLSQALLTVTAGNYPFIKQKQKHTTVYITCSSFVQGCNSLTWNQSRGPRLVHWGCRKNIFTIITVRVIL